LRALPSKLNTHFAWTLQTAGRAIDAAL